MPIGTSTSPVLTTLPPKAKTLVPLLFSVPMLPYHEAPSSKMIGTLASVSTLLITVGWPHNPLTAGNGGFGFGMPRLPSTEFISAVSSPQTNAPAPRRTLMSKEKPLPNKSSPSSP
ncbi:hypothetical protein D3C81_1369660 [compost metagenome]